MDQTHIAEIAEAYRSGKHEPEHPSYAAFKRETWEQWLDLICSGWKFSFSGTNSYASSTELFADLDKQQLVVFTGGELAADHPLAEVIDYPWTYNLIFRAVHDVLGHGATRTPFETFDGELEAYRNHARMYSQDALPVLFSETVGQLCHYYAGYGFVPVQHAVVLPERFLSYV